MKKTLMKFENNMKNSELKPGEVPVIKKNEKEEQEENLENLIKIDASICIEPNFPDEEDEELIETCGNSYEEYEENN